MYNQKRPFLWWTKSTGYILYMLRESTSILMLIYLIELIWHKKTQTEVPNFALWLGLIGAIGHTLSWLWLSVLIPPINLKKWQKVAIYFVFIAGWLVTSFMIFKYLYV